MILNDDACFYLYWKKYTWIPIFFSTWDNIQCMGFRRREWLKVNWGGVGWVVANIAKGTTGPRVECSRHCHLTICLKLVELTNGIRWQNPNNNTDTEAKCFTLSALDEITAKTTYKLQQANSKCWQKKYSKLSAVLTYCQHSLQCQHQQKRQQSLTSFELASSKSRVKSVKALLTSSRCCWLPQR